MIDGSEKRKSLVGFWSPVISYHAHVIERRNKLINHWKGLNIVVLIYTNAACISITISPSLSCWLLPGVGVCWSCHVPCKPFLGVFSIWPKKSRNFGCQPSGLQKPSRCGPSPAGCRIVMVKAVFVVLVLRPICSEQAGMREPATPACTLVPPELTVATQRWAYFLL